MIQSPFGASRLARALAARPASSIPPAPRASERRAHLRPVPALDPSERCLDLVMRALEAEQIEAVFGIPGGLLFPFFEAVERHETIRLVVSKHEEGAAFMADGYARATGRMAVCAGTGGPGSTNLITGVACAFADGVPMLVLTGQAASHALGKGAAQETTREDMDIVAMFKPITKYSAMVTSPETLSRHLKRALRLAMMGRPGPVHLNVPVDLWQRALNEEWPDPSAYRPESRAFDRDAVKEATELLLAAKRPVILVGSGVGIAGAKEHVLALAELLPARAATSPRGKGLFPEDHPLSLGVLGTAGHRAARETIFGDDVDVLLTAGASLSETATANWDSRLAPSRALIQLDIDADRIGRNYPVDVALVGDAQTVLVELVYHLHRRIREGERPASIWTKEPAPPSGEDRYDEPELRVAESSPLTPQRWRRELQAVLPEDAMLFSDIGGHMLFNIHELEIGPRQDFVLNLGFGSMGHGTVAPIGAALAGKGRPVLAIIGDACLTMNGLELLTAVEYDVPVVWLVENNQMHGITWHGSQRLGEGGKPLRSIRYQKPLEIAGLARAMGLMAWVVEAPGQLGPIVKEALRLGRPALIEVRVDGSVPPPLGGRVTTLAGFIRE